MAALRELVRLLRPGGTALVYVWAMEQEYNKKKSKYLRENRVSQGKEQEMDSDAAAVPESLGGQVPDVGDQDAPCCVAAIPDCPGEGGNASDVTDAKLPVHTNRTSFHAQDLLVPWHHKGSPGKGKPVGAAGSRAPGAVFHRYYHVFREGELEAACQTLSCVRLLQSYYDQGNWCVVLQKV